MRAHDYPTPSIDECIAVDQYFANRLAPSDSVLQQVLAANAAAGMPPHDVAAVQGQFLAVMVQICQAKRVLEIGTLGGYSTICMARALPEGGRITTIDNNAAFAAVAKNNFALAGMSERIDQQVGTALEVLATLEGPFDLIFIDADKPNNPAYLDAVLKLSRVGTTIIGDNVVRGGAVSNPNSADPNVLGVQHFLQKLASNPSLNSTALQTVGEKGWDGFSLTVVNALP